MRKKERGKEAGSNIKAESTDSGFKSQIHSLWGKLLNFSVLPFPDTVYRNNDSIYLFGWMSGLNELICAKCLEH